MVLADSHGVSRVPCYLGYNKVVKVFDYKTFTSYGATFQLLHLTFSNLIKVVPQPYLIQIVWAVPFSLAATMGIAFAFFSSGY